MIVTALGTPRIEPNATSLTALLDNTLSELAEGSIVAITSKIVSLCEGSVVAENEIDKDQLVVRESTRYLPASISKYGHHFSIANHTLIASAGIDESNGGHYYILWPRDSLASARSIRQYLAGRFGLENVGVIITDSTCQPLRRGTSGIALAHCGFRALRDYVGQPDLFGRPFKVTYANVAGGLAAAAVVAMGEGSEQTPLAVLSDLPFVDFNAASPDKTELAQLQIPPAEDLFAPFLQSVEWQTGGGAATPDA